MKFFFTKNYVYLLLGILVIIGMALRFYDLNWGAPHYFHPDERNIASSIHQLHALENLNPNFFAYGSIPIYITYGIGILMNHILYFDTSNRDLLHVTFEQAIIIGRVLSAFLSTTSLVLLYKTARIFVSKKFSLLTVALGTFSVGLIQYAHFGTFETYLTFFSLLLLYFLLIFSRTRQYRYFFFAIGIIGILTAIKVSSLILLPLPLLVCLNLAFQNIDLKIKNIFLLLLKMSILTFFSCMIVVFIFVIGNPYSLLDFQSFYGSITYESAVATGSLPVFYTQTFHGTIPVLFQFLYVMPFILNPFVWIFIIPALIIVGIKSLSKRNLVYRILIIYFFFLFLPQAILYVKWTRYMIPTLPVLLLILTVTLSIIHNQRYGIKYKFLIKKTIFTFSLTLLLASIVWTTSLIKTVYIDHDTRIVAAEIMKRKNYQTLTALSETYDMGIVPFDSAFSSITLFNFYELENDPNLSNQLPAEISRHDVFISPSQRLVKSRLQHPHTFPYGNRFYQSLNSESRFTKIYTTPCDMWCMLLYLGDPIYGVEDTANVFDRPIITIYTID